MVSKLHGGGYFQNTTLYVKLDVNDPPLQPPDFPGKCRVRALEFFKY